MNKIDNYNKLEKSYTQEKKFQYESNRFYDYFRKIPFIYLKNMLDRCGINLNQKSILISSCGCGIDAYYLKKIYALDKIFFSDIHMRAAEKTRSNFYTEPFVLADNRRLSFKDDSFDYVFVAASLHHLREPVAGLYELLRVAKKGLIVIEPNDSFLTRIFVRLGLAHEYEEDHGNFVYRFNKRDVDKIARALFFKYASASFFATHRVAKTKLEFMVLKAINLLANIFFPSQGNYLAFVINKTNDFYESRP